MIALRQQWLAANWGRGPSLRTPISIIGVFCPMKVKTAPHTESVAKTGQSPSPYDSPQYVHESGEADISPLPRKVLAIVRALD